MQFGFAELEETTCRTFALAGKWSSACGYKYRHEQVFAAVFKKLVKVDFSSTLFDTFVHYW